MAFHVHYIRYGVRVLCVLSALISVGLGAEALYRVHLFQDVYDATPSLNHVSNGYFSAVFAVGITGAAMGIAAACMFRGHAWRWLASTLGALNAALCVAYIWMHQAEVLVTYGEFVAAFGP